MIKLSQFLYKCKYHLIAVLSTSLILAYNAMFPLHTYSATESAYSAESFLDSIGINVHLGYDNTPYMQYDKLVKPMLKELGIRHIRTNIHKASNKQAISKVKDLATIGIKSIILTDPMLVSPSESVEVIKSQIDGVSMVEGPNEWNINPNNLYEGQSFPNGVINFQQELYSALKTDPQTAHLDVVAPSLAYSHLIFPDVERLKGVSCDINNMHSYPGGELPSIQTLDTVQIPGNKQLCGETKPIIATETGYHNAINYLGDKSGISDLASAKYINRLFLEYFNRGIKRTYNYELIDMKLDSQLDEKGVNWGLLKADGTRKREFKVIRHLIAILQDSQIETLSLPTSNLSYQLTGDLTDIHHTLLQKKNGTFYLILWQEVNSYDCAKKVDIFVKDRNLVLTSNTRLTKANIYRPFGSEKAFMTINNPQKIGFTVPDHPVVLELITDFTN